MAFSYYEYLPSKAAAIIACLIFIIITILHTWQLFRTRTWFFIPFVIGGLFEVIGYAARAKSADQHPNYTLMPYILQSLFLLLAPTLFAASIYMELGRILDLTEGSSRSIIGRKKLTKIFVLGDILSFLAQSGGGGMLAQGNSSGNKVIIGGLVLQLLFFGFFMVSAVVFHKRMSADPTTKVMAMPLPWKKHLTALPNHSEMAARQDPQHSCTRIPESPANSHTLASTHTQPITPPASSSSIPDPSTLPAATTNTKITAMTTNSALIANTHPQVTNSAIIDQNAAVSCLWAHERDTQALVWSASSIERLNVLTKEMEKLHHSGRYQPQRALDDAPWLWAPKSTESLYDPWSQLHMHETMKRRLEKMRSSAVAKEAMVGKKKKGNNGD
ncbi:RTA1 like protein [Aureobasidium pullulans]|nr:RTA1 like protein [Aureobasidium pullulans]